MIHDAHGWWIAQAGPPEPLPALAGDVTADVVVVGGGYTGLWAAWHASVAGADVVLLEAGRCGFGPSGRNAGFVSSFDLMVDPASSLAAAARESVEAIGAWCRAEEVEAWYRTAPHWVVSCAPAQDPVLERAVDGVRMRRLDTATVAARCGSPVFREAIEVTAGATVHPARLAFGLRRRLLERGVRIYERSPVRAVAAPATAATSAGRVRAAAAVIAAGSAGALLGPTRRRLTVGSSHLLITEPVPDVLESLGWTGGEAITDGRALLHYMRTTPDGRIAFGWAGGRMAAGVRTGGRMEVDADVVAQLRRDLLRFFPTLAGRAVVHAWGGPIDVSPTHLPEIRTLPGGRAWVALGYTGNGVGPSQLVGHALAELALTGRTTAGALLDPPARRVPPEPLRIAGAAALRRALLAKEAREERDRPVPALLGTLASLPERFGVRIVR